MGRMRGHTHRMRDGERYKVPPQSVWKNIRGLEVVAWRVDSETPYVVIEKDGVVVATLEDVFAEELAARIKLALYVLPTSK
jgi:hypothetical protein